MAWRTFEALEAAADRYDAAVASAELADRFCASSAWILSARRAFSPDATPFVLETEHGWSPLMTTTTVLGRTVVPLEASWGLASPLVGPDAVRSARALLDAVLARREDWDALFLSGLTSHSPSFTLLVSGLARRCRLGMGRGIVRRVASLEGGLDGYLGRRSAHFRKNARRLQRRAEGGVVIRRQAPTDPAEALRLYARAVESQSWKGQDGHGIADPLMAAFYAEMVPRLARHGRVRFTFGLDAETGEDVGFVLGGVFEGGYRGLQLSFAERARELGLGNLMQLATLEGLAEEGVATYDLGMDMPYKLAWAEGTVETVPLVAR